MPATWWPWQDGDGPKVTLRTEGGWEVSGRTPALCAGWLEPPGEADRKTRAPDVYWVRERPHIPLSEPRNWLISAFVSLLPPQVILILTKYYHADMGKVLESSLWR